MQSGILECCVVAFRGRTLLRSVMLMCCSKCFVDPFFAHNHDWLSKKRQRSPVTGPEGPRGFQEVKVPRFRDKGTGW